MPGSINLLKQMAFRNLCGSGLQPQYRQLTEKVAVGMRVTPHPPHGSVQALLTHTALTLDKGVKALARIRMQHSRLGKPAVD